MVAVCLVFTCIACGSIATAGVLFPSLTAATSFPAGIDIIKALALAFVLFWYIPRQFTRHLDTLRPDLLYLRPMMFWSLMVALSLGLMASGMLHAANASERVFYGGWLVAAVAAFASVSAFFGVTRPALFSGVIYLGLICVWLVVPTSGMEAYMYTEGISAHCPYAINGWKWTYAFCAMGAVSAIRLLILRQDLLRGNSARTGVQDAMRSFIDEETDK